LRQSDDLLGENPIYGGVRGPTASRQASPTRYALPTVS